MCHLPTTHHQRQRRPGPTWRPRRSVLLAALALPSAATALTLPSFGAGVPPKKARRSVGGRSSGRGAPAGRGRTVLQSSLTVDDGPSGLWKIRSDGFDASDNRDESRSSRSGGRDRRKRRQHPKKSLVPFGPVPRGGSLADVRVLPASHSASVALELTEGPWSGVRRGARGVRRAVVQTVVSANGVLRFGARERRRDDESSTELEAATMTADVAVEAVDRKSPLRIGGAINRRLRRRRSVHVKTGAVSDSAVLAAQTEAADAAHMDAWAELESALEATVDVAEGDDPFSLPLVGRFFQRNDVSLEESVAEARYEGTALASRGGASAVAGQATSSIASLSSSSVASVDSMETYIIETPLFPIILPKAWEPPVAASSVTVERRATLEISVAVEEAASAVADAKPSPQLLAAATQPFLPKDAVDTFTGRECYYPETYAALSETGMKMTLGQGRNPWVNWSGEKKTDAFLRSHGVDGDVGRGAEWYDALDKSQEVLVWVGKATSREGYGVELPIIKTTSIIHKSPKYLAELLMDSERVKIYNKMSLGRTDEKVFQTGIETQGGEFGDGESKVVRNLTKPPMVSSLIEFVTCMHARRLRPDDTSILGESEPAEGYLVVSRAVTGGEWSAGNTKSSTGEKLSRNEILMGVNILRSVPGEPDKTELTAITHVYSPMIPQMLARSAGVKGAMDFIRDMRALP